MSKYAISKFNQYQILDNIPLKQEKEYELFKAIDH